MSRAEKCGCSKVAEPIAAPSCARLALEQAASYGGLRSIASPIATHNRSQDAET